MFYCDQYLSNELRKSGELENGVFVDISLGSIEGETFTVRKDFYTVQKGLVYSITGKGDLYATGDSLWNVKRDCKRIGDYDPQAEYKFIAKHYSYEEIIKLFEIE